MPYASGKVANGFESLRVGEHVFSVAAGGLLQLAVLLQDLELCRPVVAWLALSLAVWLWGLVNCEVLRPLAAASLLSFFSFLLPAICREL